MERNYYTLLAVLLFYMGAIIDTRSEEKEFIPVADVSFLYSSVPPFRQNYLNGGSASIGASLHSGAPGRGSCSLLRFDISAIPADATITNVRLILNPVFTYPPETYPANEGIFLYELEGENSDWVEGQGPNLRDPDTDPITVPGANGSYMNMESFESETSNNGTPWLSGKTIGTADFDGEKIGSYSLSDNGLAKSQTIEINLVPNIIQAWLKDPKLARAGLVLWMTSDEAQVAASRFAVFQSRDESAPPTLIVEFKKK